VTDYEDMTAWPGGLFTTACGHMCRWDPGFPIRLRVFLRPYIAPVIGAGMAWRSSRGQCWVGSTMSTVLSLLE